MTLLVANPDNETDGGTLELDGTVHHVSAKVGNFTYVFVAGGLDDGISVFRLNQNGTLVSVFDVTDDPTLALDGVVSLSTAMVDGNTYLFATGQLDNGITVFRVNTDGSLVAVDTVVDDGSMLLTQSNATATARIGSNSYLYATSPTEDGISIFRIAGDGQLTHIGNFADSGVVELDGAAALHTVTIGANAFLIAAGSDDNGISVFSIAANGTLTHVQSATDAGALELAGASQLATAVVGSTTYLYVAGFGDNGVTVYSINALGNLTHVQNVADTAASRLTGVLSLSVVTFGGVQYLAASGAEGGISLFRINAGGQDGTAGSLTFVDNVLDTASLELGGTTTVSTATVGGTSHLIGGGFTDDGVSVLQAATTGQMFFFGQGNPADARLAYVNNDGLNQRVLIDNDPSVSLVTAFPQELGLDTAAGFYFAIVNGGNDGTGTRLVRGSLSGGAVTTLLTFDGPNNIVGDLDDEIINALFVDNINEFIYFGIQEATGGDPANTGIFRYSYNPANGSISDPTWLTTVSSSGKPTESGFSIFDVRDFDFDVTTGNIFFTEFLTSGAPDVNGLWRLNTATPNTVVQMVSQTQFPDNGSNGFIIDVEVDASTNLVYFSTESRSPFDPLNPGSGNYVASQNRIWYVAENATGATASQLTLTGMPAGNTFYPGNMVLDQQTRQLYVTSEEDGVVGSPIDDVIYVFQLNGAGTSAALINTLSALPQFTQDQANFGGLAFNIIPVLGGITTTGLAASEQAAAGTDLLSGGPTITDADGDHLASATVQITGGSFNSNENSFDDDDLGYTSSMIQSGQIAGTNITVSWSQATGTLTLTGYDTFANYQTVLNNIHFQSSGDNPTNYGLNPSRTITWTVSDGALNIPGGSQNSVTSTVTITAVNDAPTHNGVGARLMDEDTPLSLTGVSITDPDLNPALTDITVTLTATNGIVTLLDDVAGGLTGADIVGNGTAAITLTATLNQINATFGAADGFVFTNTPDYNGAGSVRIISGDGGNTGIGGALGDDDTIDIIINPVVDIADDTPTTDEDTAVDVLVFANDSFEASNEAITAFEQGAHGSVTLNDNGTGDTSDDFLVYTPDADFNGSDSFDYTVTSGGVTETATVTVTVTAVDDGVDDAATVLEDSGTNTIDVMANDHFEDVTRFISAVTQGTGGSVAIIDGPDADGVMDYVTYTPNPDFFGADSFIYTVTSGGVTEDVTVNVTVTGIDDEPTLTAIGNNPTFTEGDASSDLFSDVNPSTVEAGQTFISLTLTVTNVTDGADEILTVDGDPVALTHGNAVGPTSNGITVGVSLAGTTATVALSLPSLDTLLLSTVINGLAYANTSEDPTDADRVVTITELIDSGSSTLPNDNSAALSVASTVDVEPVNDLPVFSGDTTGSVTEAGGIANGTAGTPTASGNLDNTDLDDPDDLWLVVAAGTASIGGYGTYAVTAGGNWTYTLDDTDPAVQALTAGGMLVDTFAAQSADGTAQTVTITINGATDIANANNDAFVTDEATALGGGNLFANNGGGIDSAGDGGLAITEVNGDALAVGMPLMLASGALLTVNANGSFSYDPNGVFDYLISDPQALASGALNSSGTDTFSYTVTGGDSATVTITLDGLQSAGDELWGGAGNDFIDGTGLADWFDLSQGGIDDAEGFGGDDAFYFGAAFTGADRVDGGTGGNDQIGLEGDYTGANALVLQANTVINVEVIAALPGFDYSITTVDANVPLGGVLTIFAGNLGDDDNFTFNGAAETNGSYRVFCGTGDDIVTTGGGNDSIFFGPGKFDPQFDRVNGGGGTNDVLGLDGNYTITLDGTAIVDIETIMLLQGKPGNLSTYVLTIDNSLIVSGESMTFSGAQLETALTLDGSAEADDMVIYGGTLGDTLTGGAGDDWMHGGLGGDSMTGGDGNDIFDYTDAAQSSGTAYDRLTGFDDGVDRIDLPFAVAGGFAVASGTLDAASFGSTLETAFAGLGSHQAGVFTATGGDMIGTIFVVVDADGTAGYQTGNDYLIEMIAPVTTIDQPAMFI